MLRTLEEKYTICYCSLSNQIDQITKIFPTCSPISDLPSIIINMGETAYNNTSQSLGEWSLGIFKIWETFHNILILNSGEVIQSNSNFVLRHLRTTYLCETGWN